MSPVATAELRITPDITLPMAIADRIWLKVDKAGPGACWLWTGYKGNQAGHGAIEHGGRMIYVHRISYALACGPIPAGQVVCHRCDVPNCVNPAHLFLGTPAENWSDMRSKGRAAKPPVHRGATHPQASLTDEQIDEIRRSYIPGVTKQRDLAERYGVAQSTIWRLLHGKVRQ